MYNEIAVPLAIVILIFASSFSKDPDKFIQTFTLEKPPIIQVSYKD